MFLLTLLVAKLLPKDQFGTVTQAINFLAFFVPISGMGSYQGLLRFGAILDDKRDKEFLFRYSLYYGFLGQIVMTLVMYIIAFALFSRRQEVFLLILAFGIRFFGMFLLELQKVKFRNEFQNEKFALLEAVHSVFTLVSGLVLCYFCGFYGYIISLCLSPFVVIFFLSPLRGSIEWKFPQFGMAEFWRHSTLAGITYQISSWIFMLDIFFIGLLLGENQVADYRVSAIIPMNMFIIANIFIQTDFPKLCKYHLNKTFMFDYIKNYLKLMLLASILILVLGWFAAPFVLSFFGEHYQNTDVFRILLLAVISGILLRSLFGILLSAIGKVQWSFYIGIGSVILFSIGLYLVIPRFSIEGAAWMCVINMFLVGCVNTLVFFTQYKKLS